MAPQKKKAGVAQLAEHQPSKLRVTGSKPVSRSTVKTRGSRENRNPYFFLKMCFPTTFPTCIPLPARQSKRQCVRWPFMQAKGVQIPLGTTNNFKGSASIRLTLFFFVYLFPTPFPTLSIVLANSMMGELTPRMAEAIASSMAVKLFLPLKVPELEIIGASKEPLPHLVDQLVKRIHEIIQQ